MTRRKVITDEQLDTVCETHDEEDTENNLSCILTEEPHSIIVSNEQDDEDEASELFSNTLLSEDVTTSKVPTPSTVDPMHVKVAIKQVLSRRLRSLVLHTGKRPDGRSNTQVREIHCETGLLPGAHGSALFTRGQTQALATATLGSRAMEAKVENVDFKGYKNFYLQYRFPPSSVGEVSSCFFLSCVSSILLM
jgi:polyribonucleotide nucleotidyltransferase